MNISIALAQLDLKRADPEGNFRKAGDAVKEAAEMGAEIVLLPELWLSGFDLEHRQRYASPINEGWFIKMGELAVKHRIAVGGSLIEDNKGRYFNTFVLFRENGDLLGSYRKVHLFQMLQEDIYFEGGTEVKVVDSPWGRIGLTTCYDLRFPEIFRSCALRGAELILLVAEWPSRRIEHWKVLLQARAIENQCFIAAVNKVGTSQGAKLGGNSAIINPMGEFLVLGGAEEETLLAEINLDEVSRIRDWMPVFDDRRPDVY